MRSWWLQHQSSHAYLASSPTLNSLYTTHYILQQPTHSRLCDEGKVNRGQSQTKEETQLKPQDNSGLFLALAWPKQLNRNPKLGYINSHKLKMNDGNNPQSQNRGEAKLPA